MDLVERNSIVSLIGIFLVFDFNLGDFVADFFGDLSKRIIQVIGTYVEDLAGNDADRCLQGAYECPRDIHYVNERAPLILVEDRDFPILNGPGYQKVHNQVKSGAWRESEDCCEA